MHIIAKVIPIYKNGDKGCIKNYRPISLLSIFSKILEKVVFRKLEEHCMNQDILTDSQFGFRKGKSTETATLPFTDYILNKFDDKEFIKGVFFRSQQSF